MRNTLFALLQIGFLLSPAVNANDLVTALPYEFGQGLHFGNYYLSGYTSLEFEDQFKEPAKLSLDDLSFFIGGRVGRWFNPFTEIELAHQTLVKQGGNPGHGNVVVERFYDDALLSDSSTLRMGKILTPLGDWNTVFAPPLVPTITRPDTTALGFDTNESGVDWIYDIQDSDSADIQVYWQPESEWFKRPYRETPRNFYNVSGAHINKPFSLIDKIGASIQHGQLIETGEMYTVYGFNIIKTFGNLMLESEGITSTFSGPTLPGSGPRLHNHESGIFGLADYAFAQKWHGILEWERYQDHFVEQPSRNVLLGVDFKPNSYMIWKLEYVHQYGVPTSFSPILSGVKCSFSTLF